MLHAFQQSHVICKHVGTINVNTIHSHCP